MADGVVTSVEGVEQVLQGFQVLPRSIQRKYLGAAVREVSANEIPEIKSLTPKGPTGNLRRSVGFKLEKKRKNQTAVGVLGYRTAAGGTNREKGFHAWWIENGVATRTPKGNVLSVPLAFSKKYPYLMGKVSSIGGNVQNVFFYEVYGFEGTGRFGKWADANLPQIKERLVGKLQSKLGTAIAEAERVAIRRATRAR
jgi:hypothetical protein